MIKQLSDNITSFLYDQNIIGEIEQEAVAYGMEYIISISINLTGIMIVAFCMSKVVESIGFLIGFFVIRSFAGGYHAKTHLLCQVESFIVYVMNIISIGLVERLMNNNFEITIVISVVSCICVFIAAPIDHPNRIFSLKEYRYFRKRSRESIVLMSILMLAGEWLCKGNNMLFVSISFGILTAAISLIIVKVLKRGGKLYEEN